MRKVLSVVMMAAACVALWTTTATAQSPFQLVPAVQTTDGSAAVNIVPVRVGVGWRGYGYYGGINRPYATYGGYRGYYGGSPYYGGYRGYYGSPYYGAYRYPYATGYRGYYGGWY